MNRSNMDNQLQLAGQLAQLPDVLTANASLADRAVATVRGQIEPLKSLDLMNLDIESIEASDATLNSLQGRLKDAYTMMNDRRKPYTQRMDEVKAMFTSEEKKVVEIGNEVKAIRDGIAREKARRIQVAEQEKAAKLEKQQAQIEARSLVVRMLNDRMADIIVKTIYKMHDAFNAKPATELDAYGATLGKWTPTLTTATWQEVCAGIGNPKPQHIISEQFAKVFAEVTESEGPALEKLYVTRLTKERDDLVESIPSRKMELERIAGDAEAAKQAAERLAAEREALKAQAEQDKADRAAAIESAAQVDQVNAAFDIASEATPVVGMSKGTVVKRKYVVGSHKAWAAIMQQWVAKEMAGYTLDELNKKLSFMLTAANKRLNDGEELKADGLRTEEDYSTRATRGKKEAA